MEPESRVVCFDGTPRVNSVLDFRCSMWFDPLPPVKVLVDYHTHESKYSTELRAGRYYGHHNQHTAYFHRLENAPPDVNVCHEASRCHPPLRQQYEFGFPTDSVACRFAQSPFGLIVDLVTMTTPKVSEYGSITIHTASPSPLMPETRRRLSRTLAIPLAVLTLVVLFMSSSVRRTRDRSLESHIMASIKSSDDDSGSSQHLKQYFYDDQLVDHHGMHRHKTFTQRYYQKGDYFGGPGSPIFLIFGGEDPLENLLYPFVYDHLAQKFHAHTFALEHRFFGTSMPVENGTNAELHQLLTPDQALRDAARFIQHKRRELGCSLHRSSRHYCPAITVGGSYPGFLSGLMRFAHADG